MNLKVIDTELSKVLSGLVLDARDLEHRMTVALDHDDMDVWDLLYREAKRTKALIGSVFVNGYVEKTPEFCGPRLPQN